MMMRLLRFALLTAAFALATFAAGWWAVPLVAAIYAGITANHRRGSAVLSAFAAMLAWVILLAITAAQGPVGVLAGELGGVLSLKPIGVYAVTIAFPGLLAISAAVAARYLTAVATSG